MWRSWAQKKWSKPPVQKTVNNRHHSGYFCEFKGLRFNLSMIRRWRLISKVGGKVANGSHVLSRDAGGVLLLFDGRIHDSNLLSCLRVWIDGGSSVVDRL
ncbi:hypothetical protein Hdeb2414_s0008g00265031 [Helianthus debilis subsp. tardiflorus]